MSAALASVLALLALGAATLSAVTGVGGGVLLLGGLLLVAPVTAVVPLHGTVQTAACITRVGVFGRHARWDIVGRTTLGVVIGTALGAVAVVQLLAVDERIVKLLVATAILLSLAAKGAKLPEGHVGLRAFYGVGLAVGFLGVIAGSTGPIVSQALLMRGVRKEAHVATKSVVQMIGHGLKIPVFGVALGFEFGPWLGALAAMITAVVIGTLMGRRLLKRVSDERFTQLARGLLAFVALSILATETYSLVV